MILWISPSKHHNTWHSNTYSCESLFVIVQCSRSTFKGSYLRMMLVISYGTWNSNSTVPLHNCQQMETITAHKVHRYVKLTCQLSFAICRTQLIKRKTLKFPNILHNYHLPWYMPLFEKTPIVVSREARASPGFPSWVWKLHSPSTPETATYLTCIPTHKKWQLHQAL